MCASEIRTGFIGNAARGKFPFRRNSDKTVKVLTPSAVAAVVVAAAAAALCRITPRLSPYRNLPRDRGFYFIFFFYFSRGFSVHQPASDMRALFGFFCFSSFFRFRKNTLSSYDFRRASKYTLPAVRSKSLKFDSAQRTSSKRIQHRRRSCRFTSPPARRLFAIRFSRRHFSTAFPSSVPDEGIFSVHEQRNFIHLKFRSIT